MIVIVDYETGNVGSIANMFRKIGVAARVSSDRGDIERAEKLVLPGVGAFDHGMRRLRERGLVELLNRRVIEDEVPILGLCLGMQLFTRGSEEGSLEGLGWIDGETVRFRFEGESRGLKIPHMGWNTLHPERTHPLLSDFETAPRFYFVHSYHLVCDPAQRLGTTEYGYRFTSAVAHGNVYGLQCHPEKSHRFGMALFGAFARLPGRGDEAPEQPQ